MALDASLGSLTSLALDPRGGLSYAATTAGMLLRFDPDRFELVGLKHVAIGGSLVLWAMLPGSDGLVASSRPNALRARARAGLDADGHDAADVATSGVLASVADGASRLLHLCVTAGGCAIEEEEGAPPHPQPCGHPPSCELPEEGAGELIRIDRDLDHAQFLTGTCMC